MKSLLKICFAALLFISIQHSVFAVESLGAININAANAEEIAAALNGVGLKKARLIVEYREQFGPFVHIDQLAEVKGIGEKTIAKNASKIMLSDMQLHQ